MNNVDFSIFIFVIKALIPKTIKIFKILLPTTSSQHLKETIKACDFTLTRQEWYDLYLASEKPLP